jgi:hypothetical protein
MEYTEKQQEWLKRAKWDKTKGQVKSAATWAANAAIDPAKYFVPSSFAGAMAGNAMTATLARTAGEALGLDYGFAKGAKGYGTNYGFLGAKHFANARTTIASSGWGAAGGSIASGVGAVVGGALSIYGTVDLVSSGYQKSGIAGAAGGFAESMMWQYAGRQVMGPAIVGIFGGAAKGWAFGVGAAGAEAGFLAAGTAGLLAGAGGAALAVLTNPVTLAIAAGAYGYHKASEYIQHTDRAIARHKQVRGLELGGPIQDQFGTISTLRQRSLQALQNTHVNGRMAFGQEASLLHSSF